MLIRIVGEVSDFAEKISEHYPSLMEVITHRQVFTPGGIVRRKRRKPTRRIKAICVYDPDDDMTRITIPDSLTESLDVKAFRRVMMSQEAKNEL